MKVSEGQEVLQCPLSLVLGIKVTGSTLLILPTNLTMDSSSSRYQMEGFGVWVTTERVTIFMWMFDMVDSCASEAHWHIRLILGV